MKTASALVSLAILSITPASIAQETPDAAAQPSAQQSSAQPTAGAEGVTAPTIASSPEPEDAPEGAPRSLDERRAQALLAFYMGEVDQSLEKMKDLLRECLASAECSPPTRAALYRDAGIIAAEGKEDHATAVRAFRRAIAADRTTSIQSKYQTTKVIAAFDEARRAEGLSPVTTLTPPGVVGSSPPPAADVPTVVPAPRVPNVLLHVTGGLKLGSTMAYGAYATGQLTLETLVAHVGKTNAFVGALAHGDYNWAIDDPSNFGSWGLSAMVGGASRRTAPAKLHYLTGGLGFVHWPFVGQAGLALHARYGASFRGLALGLDADLSYLPGASQDVTQVLFGFHVGFARLL